MYKNPYEIRQRLNQRFPRTRAPPTCAAHLSAFLSCLSSRLCPIRPFGAPSPRGEGCDAREVCQQETFGHRHYLYSAMLRSFDLVLLFQISLFYIRRFSPLRMTKCAASPMNPYLPNTKSRRSDSGGIFPQFILPPFSRCGVPYTQRVWHRGSQDVRSISSSPRR